MKTVTVLLTENVGNTGIVGDVVKVKPGFARNYLLPRGLATVPSEGNIARLAERRAEAERELKERRSAMEAMIEKLEGFEITMQRSANEQGVLYGGVSQHEVAEALREAGFGLIEDRMVRLGEQIKRLDTYHIPVVLDRDLKTEIKLWVVTDRPMTDEEIEQAEEAPDAGDGSPIAADGETGVAPEEAEAPEGESEQSQGA